MSNSLKKALDAQPAEPVAHVCGLQGFGALGDVCPACLPQPAEPVAEDAARYRYLRDRTPADVLHAFGSAAGVWIDCESAEGKLILLTGDDADAAIDAAMQGEK